MMIERDSKKKPDSGRVASREAVRSLIPRVDRIRAVVSIGETPTDPIIGMDFDRDRDTSFL
jgi:hypothetical protein